MILPQKERFLQIWNSEELIALVPVHHAGGYRTTYSMLHSCSKEFLFKSSFPLYIPAHLFSSSEQAIIKYHLFSAISKFLIN
jgi:hypothetical protein